VGIKKERYTEAYARIDSSIKTKHYFEAITIEESIISDRLASFLEATDTLKSDQIHRQSLWAQLLNEVKCGRGIFPASAASELM
jgi:hypothetical protein